MGGFPPTPEQAAIVEAAKNGEDLVVTAGAGCGKTAVLEMIAHAVYPKRGAFAVFGADPAREARERFPSNFTCKTAHAFALSKTPKPFKDRFFDGAGARTGKDIAQILGITDKYKNDVTEFTPVQIAIMAREMKSQFCKSGDNELGPEHLTTDMLGFHATPAEHKDLAGVLLPYANRIWEDMQRPHGDFKYSFEDYLKQFQLGTPRLPGSLLLLDEAQDLSPVMKAIVDKQHMQKIFVGDQQQAIMGFTGAIDAMATHDGRRLALTQSFRFGERIAEVGNEFLIELGAELRVRGLPSIDSRVGEVRAPDAVLCRTNAGVIQVVLAQLAAGRRVATPGNGADIRRLAEAAQQLQAGVPCEHPDLYMFQTWGQVQAHCDSDPSAKSLKVIVKIVDDYGVDAILSMVNKLVPMGGKHARPYDVVVLTAHKAKGLQFPKVLIGPDFPPPPDDPGETMSADELMLAYVAVTRAEQLLGLGSLEWISMTPAIPTIG